MLATCFWNTCNMCNIAQFTFATSIKKQLQHIFEMTKTLHLQHRGGEVWVRWFQPLRSEPAASGGARAPAPLVPGLARQQRRGGGELGCHGEKGRRAGWRPAHSPITSSRHLHGSHRRRVDLTPAPWISPGWREDRRIYGRWGLLMGENARHWYAAASGGSTGYARYAPADPVQPRVRIPYRV
jgi:hypothetical protein